VIKQKTGNVSAGRCADFRCRISSRLPVAIVTWRIKLMGVSPRLTYLTRSKAADLREKSQFGHKRDSVTVAARLQPPPGQQLQRGSHSWRPRQRPGMLPYPSRWTTLPDRHSTDRSGFRRRANDPRSGRSDIRKTRQRESSLHAIPSLRLDNYKLDR
jgi:hypothetical protein